MTSQNAATPTAEARDDFTSLATGYQFVEAPRVEDDGTLWFSDLTGTGYYRQRPGQPVETVLADRQWIGGAVMTEDGAIICGGRGGMAWIYAATGETTPLLSEIGGEAIIAINDMEADRHGGIYGGTIDFISIMELGVAPQLGKLFYLSPDGTLRILRDDVFVSNGIGFSPDGRHMYHSEKSVGIWRYPLDPNGSPGTPDFCRVPSMKSPTARPSRAAWRISRTASRSDSPRRTASVPCWRISQPRKGVSCASTFAT